VLRLHGIVGLSDDPRYQAKLHDLKHHNGLELLYVPSSDSSRKRFRLTTDRGTDCGISIARDEELSDGAILYLDDHRAIVVRFGEQARWRIQPRSKAAALALGWNAGNLHWRVQFDDDCLVVMLDGPLSEYQERIRGLLDAGEIEEISYR
jgi:urease accessory protein